MIHQIYALRDEKTEAFMRPFHAHSEGHAIRILTNLYRDSEPTADFKAYPSDFSLYHLGLWNDLNGELEGIVPPYRLGTINDIVNTTKES